MRKFSLIFNMRSLLCLVMLLSYVACSHSSPSNPGGGPKQPPADELPKDPSPDNHDPDADLPHEAGPAIPANFLAVPLLRQAKDFSCGAACLTAVMYYWQVFSGKEEDLHPALKTSQKGTDSPAIMKVAKQYGLSAKEQDNLTLADLKKALTQNTTIILSIQAWPEKAKEPIDWKKMKTEGHYTVLTGLDDQYIYVMDPPLAGMEEGYGYIPVKEFLDRWHDGDEHSGIFLKGNTPLSNKVDKAKLNKKLSPVK